MSSQEWLYYSPSIRFIAKSIAINESSRYISAGKGPRKSYSDNDTDVITQLLFAAFADASHKIPCHDSEHGDDNGLGNVHIDSSEIFFHLQPAPLVELYSASKALYSVSETAPTQEALTCFQAATTNSSLTATRCNPLSQVPMVSTFGGPFDSLWCSFSFSFE
jgi:hypothetical protein